MPQPAPERALRRVVADLATLHPDDVAKILASFGPAERQALEALLHDYVSPSEPELAPPPPAPEAIAIDMTKLSPWLAQRLEGDPATLEITPHTRQTLRDCAAQVYPLEQGTKASRRSGWFRRKAGKAPAPRPTP